MRLSNLMFSAAVAALALGGSALPSGALAAVVHIKVTGTYIAGSEATLAPTGPVTGDLYVETTPARIASFGTYFEILSGSYLKFGTDDNNFMYNIAPGWEDQTYVYQYSSLNVFQFSNGSDYFTFRYSRSNSDVSVLEDFSSTSATSIDYYLESNNQTMRKALGGRTPPAISNQYAMPSFSNFTFTTVTAPGAVPEPATWALMIGGFGLTGAALRRRRAGAAAA
ncbi:MAG: hypothetical protein DI570_04800 [Phenylobacterium zucineum]|nr:MAG: hypothetical protein DI570_04800 [Phenylobacterium zucineum]